MVAKLKLKGIDGSASPGVEPAAYLYYDPLLGLIMNIFVEQCYQNTQRTSIVQILEKSSIFMNFHYD